MIYALGVCLVVIIGLVGSIVALASKHGAQGEALKNMGADEDALKKNAKIDASVINVSDAYDGLRHKD